MASLNKDDLDEGNSCYLRTVNFWGDLFFYITGGQFQIASDNYWYSVLI